MFFVVCSQSIKSKGRSSKRVDKELKPKENTLNMEE